LRKSAALTTFPPGSPPSPTLMIWPDPILCLFFSCFAEMPSFRLANFRGLPEDGFFFSFPFPAHKQLHPCLDPFSFGDPTPVRTLFFPISRPGMYSFRNRASSVSCLPNYELPFRPPSFPTPEHVTVLQRTRPVSPLFLCVFCNVTQARWFDLFGHVGLTMLPQTEVSCSRH